MKSFFRNIIFTGISSAMLTSCAIHEWPDTENEEQFTLKLEFQQTKFYKIDHPLDDAQSNIIRAYGDMMDYIVRAFPISNDSITLTNYKEYTFQRHISDGFDCSFNLDLEPGQYHVVAWAMPTETYGNPFNDDEFWDIKLQNEYPANTVCRDIFKGMMDVTAGTTNSATLSMTDIRL